MQSDLYVQQEMLRTRSEEKYTDSDIMCDYK